VNVAPGARTPNPTNSEKPHPWARRLGVDEHGTDKQIPHTCQGKTSLVAPALLTYAQCCRYYREAIVHAGRHSPFCMHDRFFHYKKDLLQKLRFL